MNFEEMKITQVRNIEGTTQYQVRYRSDNPKIRLKYGSMTFFREYDAATPRITAFIDGKTPKTIPVIGGRHPHPYNVLIYEEAQNE